MDIVISRVLVVAGLCMVAVSFCSLASGVGQEAGGPSAFLSSADEAIVDKQKCILLVDVTADRVLWSRREILGHAFSIIRAVKPFRSDDGTFYFPLNVWELKANQKLNSGRRYLVVGELVISLSCSLRLIDAIECDANEKQSSRLIDLIAERVSKRASFGSSKALDFCNMWCDSAFSPYADGYVDPDVFGFDVDSIKTAIAEGNEVLVIRVMSQRYSMDVKTLAEDLARNPGEDAGRFAVWQCKVEVDLTHGLEEGRMVEVRTLVKRGSPLPVMIKKPYREPLLGVGYCFVATLRKTSRNDDSFDIVKLCPLLSPGDRTAGAIAERVASEKKAVAPK